MAEKPQPSAQPSVVIDLSKGVSHGARRRREPGRPPLAAAAATRRCRWSCCVRHVSALARLKDCIPLSHTSRPPYSDKPEAAVEGEVCARGAGGHAACLGAPVPEHKPVDGRKLVGGAS